jgi:hypothetical protein
VPHTTRTRFGKSRAYCDEHGFHAALGLTVIEMTDGGTTVRRVDAGQFLD